MITAMTIEICWRRDSVDISLRIWSMGEEEAGRYRASHLHAHDLLIGLNHLVSNWQEQFHGEVGALRRHDGFVQIVSLAAEKTLDTLGCVVMKLIDLVHRILEDRAESAVLLRADFRRRDRGRDDRTNGGNG